MTPIRIGAVKLVTPFLAAILTASLYNVDAQTRNVNPSNQSDVSNKALITKETPSMSASTSTGVAMLHKIADDYYTWRNENYPVRSSDAGLHTWDNKLTDYSPGKIAERAQHVRSLLEKARAMKIDNW
ncbi:MAG TPA: hypothetical protein DCG89_00185, partial [Spartobacteria bacterium]|nr:hypothetical protein [Spartobacteria bacterium]